MRGGLPRWFEIAVALAGLALAAPFLLLAAAAIAAGSKGGVLWRQVRIGKGGVPFTLVKLRTMRPGGRGPAFTAGDDPRVTPVGRFLRRTKLDELPELWNVAKGDMSLVGPRPEVPEYVDENDPRWRRVLSVRPGLTHPVTLRLANEEKLLAEVKDEDRERFYREVLVPYKLRGYLEYLDASTSWSDLAVAGRTALAAVKGRPEPPTREEIERTLERPDSPDPL